MQTKDSLPKCWNSNASHSTRIRLISVIHPKGPELQCFHIFMAIDMVAIRSWEYNITLLFIGCCIKDRFKLDWNLEGRRWSGTSMFLKPCMLPRCLEKEHGLNFFELASLPPFNDNFVSQISIWLRPSCVARGLKPSTSRANCSQRFLGLPSVEL